MKEDIPISQRQVENGKTKATDTKVPRPNSSHLKFSTNKLPFASSNKLFHNIYDSSQKKRERTVHKQGIKLPLYKNRSFSVFFFFFFVSFFPRFTVYATKKAVIVSQAQLFLITLFEHTIAKQYIHFGGFVKVLTFFFFFQFFLIIIIIIFFVFFFF